MRTWALTPRLSDASNQPPDKGSWLSSTWSKLKGAVTGKAGDEGASSEDAEADADWDSGTCEEPTCFDSDAPEDERDDQEEHEGAPHQAGECCGGWQRCYGQEELQ